jgi:hypothetical protein
VIAVIAPDVRARMDDVTIDTVVLAAAAGVPCMVCAAMMPGGDTGQAHVIGLRERVTGRTLMRFAHPSCSASKIIDVDALPAPTTPPPPPAQQTGLAWAITARATLSPALVFAWDLAHLVGSPIAPTTLLESFRLDGFTATAAPLATLNVPRVASVQLSRSGALMRIVAPDATEDLELANAIISERRIFHVAAKQRYLILIVGVNLGLAETGFDNVEYLLRSGDALAGAVRYVDPELAAQRLRNPTSRWSRISPGARRERRLQRQAGNAS